MPRPKKERRGEKPQWRAREKTWKARVWEADGSCSGWVDLGTNNKEIAFQRYERWLETGVPPAGGKGKETFAVEAERVIKHHEETKAIDAQRAKARRSRIRKFALPSIGHLEVGALEAHHITAVLKVAARTHAEGTVLNLRSDISQILAELVSEGEVPLNIARSLPLPKGTTVDTRERMSLTDEQILIFQKKRGFKEPIDLMVRFCREIAGHRTSDLHAGLWQEVDRVHFAWMKVRRPKTDGQVGGATNVRNRKARAYEKVTHEIDESLRPSIRQYWEAMGRPERGPIFPRLRDAVEKPMKMKDGRVVTRKGGKAGERKGDGNSYAAALRRAVWECSIYDPMPVGTLIDGEPTTEAFDPKHPKKELCRLQTDTDETRRLSFHSLRGALVTALADAGVSEADQLATTGHSQLTTQLKSYMGKRRVKVPKSALPGGAVEEKTGTPAAPILTDEQKAALRALLGEAPQSAPSNPPESRTSRDSVPGFGMKPTRSASPPLAN